MFQNQSFKRQRESFVAQFAPDGAGFVYRRFQAGAAFRVTAAERDAFIADFDRRQRLRYWLFMLALIAAMAGFVAATILFDFDLKNIVPAAASIAAIGALLIAFVVTSMRDYTAPARALEQRAPVAEALSLDERRTLTLSSLTWGKLATAAGLMGLAVARGYPFEGWNKLWLIFAGAGFLLVAVQAFRKWRFDTDLR